MIGSGKSHIRTVVSIAQAQSLDQEPPAAVKAFASLGAFGKCDNNEERDLHRWLQGLHGIELEVYYEKFTIQALWRRQVIQPTAIIIMDQENLLAFHQ